MPTMQSIGVHPRLCDRLAGLGGGAIAEKVEGSLRQLGPPKGGIEADQATAPPVRTPTALLARDPTRLASGLGLPISAVFDLRAAVADALVMANGGGHGRHAASIVAQVSDGLLRLRETLDDGGGAAKGKKRKRNGDETRDNKDGICAASTVDATASLFHPRRRPPPIVVGAVTALDGCVHDALIAAAAATNALVTGSANLDALLSPPPGFERGGAPCRLHLASVLSLPPPQTFPQQCRRQQRIRSHSKGGSDDDGSGNESHSNDDACNSFIGPTGLVPSKGIQYGLVTEVVGPPSSGKTQLALSLATKAASAGANVRYLVGGGGSASVQPLARRLRQMVISDLSGVGSGDADGDATQSKRRQQRDIRAALGRVEFISAPDGCRLLAALSRIEEETLRNWDRNTEGEGGSLLVILDSASGCLGPDFYGDDPAFGVHVGSCLVNQVGLELRRLVRTLDGSSRGNGISTVGRCAVFVTNGTVGQGVGGGEAGRDGRGAVAAMFKAALGQVWRAADVRVHLSVISDDDGNDSVAISPEGEVPGLRVMSRKTVRATLEKHPSKSCHHMEEEERTVQFAIEAAGIIDA